MTPTLVLLAALSAAPSSVDCASVHSARAHFIAEGLDLAPLDRLDDKHCGPQLAQFSPGARTQRRDDRRQQRVVSADCQELRNLAAMAAGFGDDVSAPVTEIKRFLCKTGLGLPQYWPNGKLARAGATTWYWPNGKLARNGANTWYWPNGKLAKNGANTRYWPSGKLAQNGSPTWYWPSGRLAQNGSTYYTVDGQLLRDYASFVYLACSRDERACPQRGGRRGQRQLSMAEMLAAAYGGGGG
jgi:hypothetical protein